MAPDTDQLELTFRGADPADPVVEIRPSTRRRKTVGAHWEGDTIVVVVPHRLPKRQQREFAASLSAQLIEARRQTHPSDAELLARSLDLLARHLPEVAPPASVNWTNRERSRWGSCTLADRTIRINDLLRGVPSWVLDAILVHELAHLVRPRHDADFQELVARYPRTADADLYLAGLQHGLTQRP